MIVERNDKEVIVRLNGSVDINFPQQTLNYLRYLEIGSKSSATQDQVDQLAKETKRGWWAKNRSRFIK